ncbi:MAG: DUF1670 domain-containing protein [Thiovulaceae bacterium]|nr:DUF1670 domain-containing protein [Sulfurimonadaceae bacterium]
MIRPPDSVKRYSSAKERFLKPVIMNFFARECPRFFGPVLREKITEELLALFESLSPETSRLKPGQILWNALDKNTRGDSPKRKYVPVILTVISEEDVQLLVEGVLMSKITENAIARMIREAYSQGGVLSSRDLGLITLRHPTTTSSIRKRFEENHDCTLPHTGALHDMGSAVSHKTIIVRKAILEKKDPAAVARETNHSQAAVDHYLKDYHRVKMLYNLNYDVEFINLATQIAKHVIIQYLDIIKNEQHSP